MQNAMNWISNLINMDYKAVKERNNKIIQFIILVDDI